MVGWEESEILVNYEGHFVHFNISQVLPKRSFIGEDRMETAFLFVTPRLQLHRAYVTKPNSFAISTHF